MRNSTLAAITCALALVTVLASRHDDGGHRAAADEPAPPTVVEVSGTLADIPVRDPDTGVHYDRDDWPTWEPVKGTCDTREWLVRTTGQGVRVDAACEATAGTWTSPYDGKTTTDVGTFDADHVVPLHEAAVSGARGWSRQQREVFANDWRRNLILVTAHENRRKGDDDPARYRPPRHAFWCTYATKYVAVKTHYHLSVDRDEKAALAAMLRGC